jgi:hypothetical protein
MGKHFNIYLVDKAFDNMHHALGRPWPEHILDGSYRNHFAVDANSDLAAELRASPYWSESLARDKMGFFHVSPEGREALLKHVMENIDIPRRYGLRYKNDDADGTYIVVAQSRGAAIYKAWSASECGYSLVEYAALVKSARIYRPALQTKGGA